MSGKLFIAIPSYKWINVEAVHCMFGLLSADPNHSRMLALHGGEGFVGRSRNQICSRFLESDFDELLQIDSDILYTPEAVDRIASLDVPVVAAFYAKKAPGKPVWIANRTSEGGSLTVDTDERGLVKVETIGTGFMKVQRKVLEAMRDSGLAARYIVDGTDIVEYEFYPFRVVKGRLRSEDWGFCDNAHHLGFDVYGDTRNVVRHLGTAIYPTQESEMIHRMSRTIQKLQHANVKVPKEIFEAMSLDESCNAAS